jgi:hypothetical protein
MRGTALCLALLVSACAGPLTDEQEENEILTANGCGVERWSVKTGTDSQAGQVSLSPAATTIAQLQAFSGVTSPPLDSRVAPAELATWQLTDVTLVQFKSETDGDFHLVLSSGGVTMIAEIPSPSCVGSGSPFAPGIALARQQFTARYTPSGSFVSANTPVTVTGAGFFDFAHGQTDAAPNQIELHPVLSICFGLGCAPGSPPPDAGPVDAGSAPDSGIDAGVSDAGADDAGPLADAGATDSGASAPPDSGTAGAPDAGGTPDHLPTRGCSTTGAASLPILALLAALCARRRREPRI